MVKIGMTERGDAGLDFSWMRTYKNYDGVILVTKCLSHIFIEQAAMANSIVHATITGLGGSVYEPNVPSFAISKIMFEKLVNTLGPERVVLRIDPIIPDERGIAKAIFVYDQLHTNFPKKTRVRISFLDQYPHVKDRFEKAGLKPLGYYFHAPIELRNKIAASFPDAEICGEPGMECVGCISKKDLEVLKISTDFPENKIGGWQREECKCLACKVEMLKQKRPCRHECLYCYWK